MRRRLYFLLPDSKTTSEIVNELLLERVDIGHIHVMARSGTSMSGLPEANIMQKSDLVYGLEKGLLIGGFTGIVAGQGGVMSMVGLPPSSGISRLLVLRR